MSASSASYIDHYVARFRVQQRHHFAREHGLMILRPQLGLTSDNPTVSAALYRLSEVKLAQNSSHPDLLQISSFAPWPTITADWLCVIPACSLKCLGIPNLY